jgi:hypothetical protein
MSMSVKAFYKELLSLDSENRGNVTAG